MSYEDNYKNLCREALLKLELAAIDDIDGWQKPSWSFRHIFYKKDGETLFSIEEKPNYASDDCNAYLIQFNCKGHLIHTIFKDGYSYLSGMCKYEKMFRDIVDRLNQKEKDQLYFDKSNDLENLIKGI